ncbi:MAG: hypothetical protein LUI05_01610 [Oscillospiraceae bacterium]|nr:hypothetical protein [Oscillospiraceae bacterium]
MKGVSMTGEEYRKPTDKHIQPFIDKCKQSSVESCKPECNSIPNGVIAKESPLLDKTVNNTVYDININPFDVFLRERGNAHKIASLYVGLIF